MLNFLLKILVSYYYLTIFGPSTVFGNVTTPTNQLQNIRQDVVFMWNTTNGNSILSVTWGLLASNGDIKPQFIYISKRTNDPVFQPDLDKTAVRYKGRVSWVGDLSTGHAWFKLTNLTLQDTNQYVAEIREQGQSEAFKYSTNLTVAAIPTFQHFPTSPYLVEVIEGRDLVISCTAIGPPTPTVQWFTSDGTAITSVSVTGTVTLTKTNVQRSLSGTQYKCVASNNPNSDPVSTMIKVVVLYPPHTDVTPSNVTVVQGNVISLSCTADGYPPPSISWTKTDGVIKADHTVAGGTLRIPDAIKTDSGKYICTAKNTYDSREHTDNATATVVVKYQPSIIMERLLNRTVNVTEPLSIECNADGNPPPTIKWKPPTGSVHTGNVYNIPSVSRSHAGIYTCTAMNGIGREAMASIQVNVQYKPEIDLSKSSLATKSWNGSSIRLRCFAAGLPAPRISWYKPTDQHITTGVNIVPGGSEVTVLTTTDQGDYGQHKCRATNILGSDEHVINVTQLFPPNCSNFAMSEDDIEASSITVRWNKPGYDGGSPVTGYEVQIDTNPLQDQNTVDTSVKFNGLTKDTKYKVEIFAKNIAGYGRPCIETITTKKRGKPAVPELTVTLDQSAGLSVRLTWTRPDNNGKEITKYTIYMKEDTAAEFTKTGDVFDPAVLEYTVKKNIEYGKTYKFIVTAWNELGECEYDDTMFKSKTMPEVGPTSAADANGTEKSLGGTNLKYLTGVGVIAAILVASLVLNVLQFLYIWKKMRLNENRRNPDKERDTNQGKEDDQVYDNAFELKENPSSQAVLESDCIQTPKPAPEYEAVQPQRGRHQKNPSKMIENSSPYETPSHHTQPSIYQALSTTGPAQVNTGPMYEPLRTTVPRNDETNMYQQLDLRNQRSDYQTLHIDSSDSMI